MAASAEFFRRQAERCAEIARRTHDEDSRERCEQLRQTYCRLAEMEEQQARQRSTGVLRRPVA